MTIRSGPGLFANAISREARRIGAWELIQPIGSGWASVKGLLSGTEIALTTVGSRSRARYFIRADDSEVTVLNLSDSTMPHQVMREIQGLILNRPEAFGLTELSSGVVRVAPDGVFVNGRKTAELDHVLECVPRDDVREIRIPGKTRGSPGWAIAGAGLGLLFSRPIYVGAADCPRIGNCAASLLRTSSILWLPIAGGVLGYFGLAQRTPEKVIYRAQGIAAD